MIEGPRAALRASKPVCPTQKYAGFRAAGRVVIHEFIAVQKRLGGAAAQRGFADSQSLLS